MLNLDVDRELTRSPVDIIPLNPFACELNQLSLRLSQNSTNYNSEVLTSQL